MLYQSALACVTDLLVASFKREVIVNNLGTRAPDENQTKKLLEQIQRLVGHPVWSTPYARDAQMLNVKNALEKNQEAKDSFEKVALDLSYMVMGDQTGAYNQYWRHEP